MPLMLLEARIIVAKFLSWLKLVPPSWLSGFIVGSDCFGGLTVITDDPFWVSVPLYTTPGLSSSGGQSTPALFQTGEVVSVPLTVALPVTVICPIAVSPPRIVSFGVTRRTRVPE